MPWGHSATLRVRHVCIALLFAYDTEQTAAAFPLRQFHTPLEIHIRAFTAQRPVSGMDDLAPRHPPPPQAPADYAGLDFSAAAALHPPPQCRAVIARSVGDPFASDDPQPRQRLLRTRAPAEASLLRIDAVVLCTATSAANLRPLPSAATHHPDRCCRVPNRASPNLICASTILPRFRAAAVAALTYSAKIIPKTAEAIHRLGGGSAVAHSGELFPRTPILRRPLRVIFLKISIRSACQRIEKFSFRQSKEKFRRKPAFQSAGFHLFTASELRASAALSQFSAKR